MASISRLKILIQTEGFFQPRMEPDGHRFFLQTIPARFIRVNPVLSVVKNSFLRDLRGEKVRGLRLRLRVRLGFPLAVSA
jgi:hypothetical protein